MNPNHTFYIERHENENSHLSLDGTWQFAFLNAKTDSPDEIDFPYESPIPASGFRCLVNAGLKPDPYFGTNSKLFRGVDEKIWYFRRTFKLPETIENKDVFLCFDGVSYRCRVWLNGTLLCEHEGMFGGPIAEVGELVKPGENELTVEVVPPKPDFSRGLTKDPESKKEIVPWNIRRDASCSNGDFTVFGIWKSVRIEILPKYHLSRPHLITESVENNRAVLRLSVEIADPQVKELDVPSADVEHSWSLYQNAYNGCSLTVPTGKKLTVGITLTDKATGNLAYSSEETIDLWDKSRITTAPRYYPECQFYETGIELEDPKLWNPNGFGSPDLYRVTLTLSDETGLLDTVAFDTGVRTVAYARTAAPRTRTRWDEFRFIINGRPMFIKGMNWMPVDYLFDCSDEEYRWTLELMKKEGVQLVRVWSGGGMPEDDRFYSLCDELGLMVMQDSFIANQTSEEWDRRVLAAQVCRNLYRIRNHPSLILHTGGNEINPYALGNDAAMAVISREIADLDPSRRFWRTSPDKGSAHIYMDMEPVCYRKFYRALPFIGESGIHSFPNAKSLRQQLSKEEFDRPLSNIFTNEFVKGNPELHNHFTEFIPERIPRMMSRASMISNVRGISLSDLCEASHLASYEFYQIMINAMRENDPICGGILPWVFRRPWTTVAIQLLDGLGDPIGPYYAVKNAYAPLCTELSLNEVTYAPGETFAPELRVLCDGTESRRGLDVRYEVFAPDFTKVYDERFACDISPEDGQKIYRPAPFTLPDEWTEHYFFLRSSAYNENGMVCQSFYWCKPLARFADAEALQEYRSKRSNNIDFDRGPWLKPQVAALDGALTLDVLEKRVRKVGADRRLTLLVRVTNPGTLPVFPVRLEVEEDCTLSAADDSWFFLPAGEARELSMEIRVKPGSPEVLTVSASAFNAAKQSVPVTL